MLQFMIVKIQLLRFNLHNQAAYMTLEHCIMQVTENATTIKAYPKGSWFAPCFFGEHECFQHLDEMMAAGSIDMEGVVGAHRHQASWML